MDINNDKIKEIIKHCEEDIADLTIMMCKETNENMMMVWKYQYNLNNEIIKSISIGSYEVASALMRELSRSIVVATTYSMIHERRKTIKLEP